MTKQQRQLIIGLTLGILIVVGLWFVLGKHDSSTKARTPKRIIATTIAQAQVLNALDIDLVGVPTAANDQSLPKRYRNLPKVGNHVSPNLEKIASLKPDVVYLDSALVEDYQAKLQAEKISTTALDFSTLSKLQSSITKLGKTYDKQATAKKLVQSLNLKASNTKRQPKVLLLMGMPGGSYLVGTSKSYVGDLITRAGGKLVGDSGQSAYTTMNVEQISAQEPTVIIRMAHAMPESVFASFDTLFTEPAWQNLPAVQSNHVYNAEEPLFGMTANLNAPKAYQQLQTWFAEVQ
jgi:iron complex transport system substrate-binding protein